MYRSILVAVDVDQPRSWETALPVAVELARCFSARLTLCSVLRDAQAALDAEWSTIGYRQMIDLTHIKLSQLTPELPNVDVEVATGTVCSGLLDVVERIGADLLVMSSHPPRVADYLISPQAERVMRHASCSVLVVKEQVGTEIEPATLGDSPYTKP